MGSTVKAWMWQCQDCMRECVPIRAESRCMCGHRLREHAEGHKCTNKSCSCPHFTFIVAEGSWILRCRCKHRHTEHCPVSHACKKPTCSCSGFHSPWVCNCDHPWASHKQVIVEKQVLRICDMIAQQQEAAAEEEHPDQPSLQTAARAPPTAPAPLDIQGRVLDSSAHCKHGAFMLSSAAGQNSSSQSESKLAELRASRAIQQQMRQQKMQASTFTAARKPEVNSTADAAVVEAGALAENGLLVVEGDLNCDVNRWDLLQRGRLS